MHAHAHTQRGYYVSNCLDIIMDAFMTLANATGYKLPIVQSVSVKQCDKIKSGNGIV